MNVFNYMRSRIQSLCLMAAALSYGQQIAADATKLVINEIQVANIDMFIDLSFNYGGWIELYNPTESSISLYGLYITDDPTNPKKFRLPAGIGTVPAGGHQTIWFDHHTAANENTMSKTAYKQVDFKLEYEGGSIYLFDAKQNLLASQQYPPAITRCSYARTTDGGDVWSYCSTPTPAASNVGSSFANSQLPLPQADCDGGVFSQPITMKVKIPTGTQLYYTTDGTTPTLTNGLRSTTGIFEVQQTTVFRFRLFRNGYLPSSVLTRSFIFKDREYYLPIISVVTNPDNLYDKKIGAYVDGTNGISGNNKSSSNKNRSWERPVNIEYFVPDDQGEYSLALCQETDFQVCGGWSRHFAPSSFRIKATKQYEGQNFLPYPFFKNDKPYIKNKAVQIRNGGNDYNCRIIDAAIQQCMITSGLYVDCMATQPAHVFFNGIFQYTYNIRETANKNLSYSNYGIDKDSVDEFEINSVQGYYQKSGDNKAFMQWLRLTEQLAADPTNDSIYQKICELVDIDNYCNYMAAECYIGCSDWITNCNNIKGFRTQAEGGRFHLIILDLDSGFTWDDIIRRIPSSLGDSRYTGGQSFLVKIFLNMLKYEPFKKRLADTFCLVAGSVFEPERCTAIIQEMANKTTEALDWEGLSPWSSAYSLIDRISDPTRRDNRINSMRSYLKQPLPHRVKLRSNLPGALLQVNGLTIPTGRFDGQLCAPATITAQSPSGWQFAGWQRDGEVISSQPVVALDDEWDYFDQGSLDGKTWKARTYSASGWSTGKGPFGYGTIGIEAGVADYNTTLDYGSDYNNKRPTYYFRKSFLLTKKATDEDFYHLTYYVDDGCVIYLNGTEIARYHMADGTPTYSQFSTSYEANKAYCDSLFIPNELLRAGTNVLVAEVHNTHASSSDIYWGATITHGAYEIVSTDEALELETLDQSVEHSLQALFKPVSDRRAIEAHAAPIKINEVCAGNSIYINEYFKKNDWIELYNTTDTDLDAAGLYLSDEYNSPELYQIPTTTPLNTIIPAHGHLVIWADKLDDRSQLHTGFKLSNKDRSIVRLTSSEEFVQKNAAYFEEHPQLSTFSDLITYDFHQGDQSVGRFPDGGDTYYVMYHPTIGQANAQHTFDQIMGVDEAVFTGIQDVESEDLARTDDYRPATIEGYYSLGGLFLGNERRNLRPGLYILRLSDGTSRKISLR